MDVDQQIPVQGLDIKEYPHSGKNKVRCGQGAISRLGVPFTSRKCEPLMEGAVKHLAGGQVVCFLKGGSDSESFIILTINPPSLRLHLLHRKESAPAAMGTSGFTQDFSIRQIRSLLKALHKSHINHRRPGQSCSLSAPPQDWNTYRPAR